MRVIAFIEDEDVIRNILKHLGLWDIKRNPRPLANVYPGLNLSLRQKSVKNEHVSYKFQLTAESRSVNGIAGLDGFLACPALVV